MIPLPGPPQLEFNYRAFLSYRAADARQAAWLHRRLETYIVPRALVGTRGEYGIVPRRLGRIFRDRDEARASERIENVFAEKLSESQHLIVLCTPNAVARGSWVPREIEIFRERRPDGPIHAVIGAGVPPACFPASLLRVTPDGRTEAPLAADLRPFRDGGADGEERGLIRLIASLLGVGFDDLWRREERRRRTRRITKVVETMAIAAIVAGIVWVGNFYRTHARVTVDVGSVIDADGSARIVASEETPSENRSRVFLDTLIDGRELTQWMPASNLIVRAAANYRDGAERALSWHLILVPGFAYGTKRLHLRAPSENAIRAHPGMAYVPPVNWVHGREKDVRSNAEPFWIDIRPPTVSEYLPQAERLMNDGVLDPENSFLLTARQQSAGLEAVGLDQARTLGRELGDILGVIAQGTSANVSAPGDLVTGLVKAPCQDCPAPMTRHEAEIYCRSRNMRLPTALEWELAVRGVDGRAYPWGDRFDPSRANVPGLPAAGDPSPELKPVDAYRQHRSPFGLFDTVGNAGDWVTNDVGSYDRVYMGATYRFNPEDATAFRMLPVTDSDYLIREITARCVAPAAQ